MTINSEFAMNSHETSMQSLTLIGREVMLPYNFCVCMFPHVAW